MMTRQTLSDFMNLFLSGDREPLDSWIAAALVSGNEQRVAQARFTASFIARVTMQPVETWRDDYFLGHMLGSRATLASVIKPNWAKPLSAIDQPVRLVGEQGIGDQIRWSHHLQSLSPEEVADITLTDKLVPLLADCFPQFQFSGMATPPPRGSLSIEKSQPPTFALGDLDGFAWHRHSNPQPSGFLNLSQEALERGQKRLSHALENAPKGRPRIGLTFRSMVRDAFRNLHYSDAEHWAGFFEAADVTIVVLQYGITDQELGILKDAGADRVVCVPGLDLVSDILGLAGVIAHLDGVIGASTMALDLASALGTPTYRIMPSVYAGDDRKGAEGHPWYGPACQLIPYNLQEDWPDIIKRAADIVAAQGQP